MSRWAETSCSRSRSRSRSALPSLPMVVRVGVETGLPLIRCPQCGLDWVVELRVKKDNNNNGRVFFKCPRNIEWEVPRRCTWYKWQRLYLQELCALDFVDIHVDRVEPAPVIGWQSESDSGAGCSSAGVVQEEEDRGSDDKVDRLVAAVKWLAICVIVVVVALVWMAMHNK
ncbi:unnamed protein product [Urochloa decumbens]|uniref:GRF-type domain-containing protein n=1 Tax=Urochloa decumbens TaxID=240449 RepID=A0ABC9A4Y4_9POAL